MSISYQSDADSYHFRTAVVNEAPCECAGATRAADGRRAQKHPLKRNESNRLQAGGQAEMPGLHLATLAVAQRALTHDE